MVKLKVVNCQTFPGQRPISLQDGASVLTTCVVAANVHGKSAVAPATDVLLTILIPLSGVQHHHCLMRTSNSRATCVVGEYGGQIGGALRTRCWARSTNCC